MVTTTNDKIIIQIECSTPAEYLRDIQRSIIYSLQHVEYTEAMDLKEVECSNFFMLELLKQTLNEEHNINSEK